jgi:hypothetical protein
MARLTCPGMPRLLDAGFVLFCEEGGCCPWPRPAQWEASWYDAPVERIGR